MCSAVNGSSASGGSGFKFASALAEVALGALTTVEHDDFVGDDIKGKAFAAILGFVLARFEATLDIHARAFANPLGECFRLTTKNGHAEPLGMVSPLAITLASTSGRGHAEARHGSAILGVPLLGIAAQIADHDHLA